MDVHAVIGAFLGLAGGGAVGFLLGRRFKAGCHRGAFWAASGGSLVLGVLVIFLGEIAGLTFIAGSGVGLVTGGLNGLRWGMGRLGDVPRGDDGEALAATSECPPKSRGDRPHPVT